MSLAMRMKFATQTFRTLELVRVLLLMAALLLAPMAFAADDAKGSDDPVLRSLQVEMARSKAELKLENSPVPYFIDYRVVDVENWDADVAFGSVRNESKSRARFVLVQVRVGDYKQDNSSGRGEGSFELVPVDGDEQSFRFQVWAATDKAYKQAVEALTEKQSRLKNLTIDHPVDDFAKAAPVVSLGAVATLHLDRDAWLKQMREATSLYSTDARVQFLGSTISTKAVNRYEVNSEGTVVRSGQEIYRITLGATSQADDGMHLERAQAFGGHSASDILPAGEFVEKARAMVASLKELRSAPLADEDYHGPVLFSADAAATVFTSLVGDNALGHKPELGQNARVSGAFASSYKTRVLPEFLNIVDDPTLTTAGGKNLMGHYEVDDEGVPAQRVVLVEKGVLVNYLLGRTPIRDFSASNGHGRANVPLSWTGPGLGNLVVTASNGMPVAGLKQKLIAMCKERGLDYGYRVETMGGARLPRLLYRVYTSDGHEELVRGALFGDLDQRSMRTALVAAGNDVWVENEILPMPRSIVSPSILFDDLELKRQTIGKEKLPEYPPPSAN